MELSQLSRSNYKIQAQENYKELWCLGPRENQMWVKEKSKVQHMEGGATHIDELEDIDNLSAQEVRRPVACLLSGVTV